jgi:dipeptidyl aminopeptidase/acylaminoacyl peptidase
MAHTRSSVAPARHAILVLLAAVSAAVSAALAPRDVAAQAVRPMDHNVYEAWDTIGGETISRDGRWILYNRLRYDRDDVLVVRAVTGDAAHVFPRGTGARFDEASRHVIFTVKPARDSVLQARRDRRRADQMPRDTLAILDLHTGEVARVPGVRSFRLPERAGGWLAYQLERAPTAAGGGQPASPPAAAAGQPAAAGQAGEAARRKEPGTPLVVRSLTTREERRIDDVVAYVFSNDGRSLAYAVSTADGAADGVFVMDVAGGGLATVLAGAGEYRRLVFDESGGQLAFLTNRDTWGEAGPEYALYHWQPRLAAARRVAAAGSAGVPAGWWVSEHGGVTFSQNGQRLFFGTAPRPEPEEEDGLLPEERVRVDIWHWQDPLIQPMQLRRAQQERRRSFQAVVHLRDGRDGRVVQLADESMPDVSVGSRGDADVAVGTAAEPYARLISWDSPGWSDHYLVDMRTGARTLTRQRAQGGMSLSPGSRYAVWFDNETNAWLALDVRTRRVVDMTSSIPHAFHNEEHDQPSPARPLGTAGWLEGDAALLVYDGHDVWAVDPAGRTAPRSVTAGAGRRDGLRFRVVRLDRDEPYVPADRPLLLSAFDPRSKAAGFYGGRLQGGEPERLVMEDYMFSTPRKAADADVLLFSRQSFTEFPDLWVSGPGMSDMRRVTAENPQQAHYRWGTAELVAWTSLDGTPLQGILYRPDDFDPARQYPMIAYFYERMSDNLHLHYAPVPHRSRINPTFYTSRGYLVFVPDIVYNVGYPGESAMNSIMPGVMKLLERGYVDRDRLALQGHSWGGYQIAFMVTRTNLFRAAGAGAPVANMTSAYGGIRWETGMGRQFQYERTQSRLGGSLWEMPVRYIENSPLFWLDKVETPLLIMHNDRDGAVPWEQGIELYLGLRRLDKPAWLINYNEEPHWPTTHANKRDWNIRMQQFFDHYLLDTPAPVWLRDGVPATAKGRTLGYELTGALTDRK